MTDRPLRGVRIDLEAIRHNVRAAVSREPAMPVLAVVSADGYGHGALQTARAAIEAGAAGLCVGRVDEGVALRAAGIRVPILAEATASAEERAEGSENGIAIALDAHRPGLDGARRVSETLYGLGPKSARNGLRPAMRVSAQVVATKTIEAGEGVSYGYTYRATRRTNLALVSIGYADGLDRRASNRGTLWLDGAPRLIAGRVAMNYVVLELGEDSTTVGAEAVLFGDEARGEPSATRWAESIGVPVSAVVCTIGAHVARSYV